MIVIGILVDIFIDEFAAKLIAATSANMKITNGFNMTDIRKLIKKSPKMHRQEKDNCLPHSRGI